MYQVLGEFEVGVGEEDSMEPQRFEVWENVFTEQTRMNLGCDGVSLYVLRSWFLVFSNEIFRSLYGIQYQ